DVSRLNRTAGPLIGLASRELARILRVARRLSRSLAGAFDPTIGPLCALWRGASIPSDDSTRQALCHAGQGSLRISGERVTLSHPRSAIDLAGFGKGLTRDRIGAWLRRRGCTTALLTFGESSLVAVGRPAAQRWPVLLRHPFGDFAGQFSLEDRACSTSAAFARSHRIGNRTVSDVIDPRTGRPVARDAQVTVVADSAAAAEAVSTALLVLGREAVDDIARRMNVDVCWIDRSGMYTVPRSFLRRASS